MSHNHELVVTILSRSHELVVQHPSTVTLLHYGTLVIYYLHDF